MVSLSIVSFNSAAVIQDCLFSLKETGNLALVSELYVIDNNSTDNTQEIIKSYSDLFPKLRLITNASNQGFGAAHNQAIQLSKSSYHVICNPDIKFKEGTLASLIHALENNPRMGLVAP
jgi:GT2 family glycosyltransferase